MTVPVILVIIRTSVFLVWEWAFPGSKPPNSAGWYFRALLISFIQLGITLLTGKFWL